MDTIENNIENKETRRINGRFALGVSGNPNGRTRMSPNKIKREAGQS